MRVDSGTRMHFIGIGGIGMSGLAEICVGRGAAVSGCDTRAGRSTQRLAKRGVELHVGHTPDHLDQPTDLVIYSSAVSSKEPELLAARTRGVRTISRGELLAELAADSRLIAIAGAHGKTTVSGMAAHLLVEAGWDPSVAVGGVMRALGTNARFGRGRFLVAESDESDGSFLHLFPEVAIVTNIDREHLNYYHTLDRVLDAFQQFVDQLRPGGILIRCADDPLVAELLCAVPSMTYGLDAEADVTARGLRPRGLGSTFDARVRGQSLGTFRLQVPGRHNVLNALAVIGLGLTLDLPVMTIREALAGFTGTQRRFNLLRLPRDIWLVEDYAHHPAEIRATLAADTAASRHRLVVFQPHRFSRTQALEQEFTTCFDRADGVIVTDIYSAFEPPIPGVSGERLARLIRGHGHPCVCYVPTPDVSMYVTRIARPGDTFFFLGAGDIGEVCHAVATQLRAAQRAAR